MLCSKKDAVGFEVRKLEKKKKKKKVRRLDTEAAGSWQVTQELDSAGQEFGIISV